MQNQTLLTTPIPRFVRAGQTWRQHGALHLASALIAALMLLPLVYLVVRSLGVGLGEATTLLLRPRTLEVMLNSVLLALTATLVSLLIALPYAWLTVRTDLPGQRFWSVVGVLPLVIPSYVGAFALVAMVGPRGALQGWLAPLGVERLPSIYGFHGAAIVLSLFSYPYLLLSIRSGLRNLDPALEEAAQGLGFTPWAAFWRITVPNLRPAIAAGSLLVALYVISDFGAVATLRFNTFTRAIYVQYLSSFDRSLASLLALTLVMVTLLLLIGAQRIQGRKALYRTSAGAARKARPIPLGQWRWVGILFCAIVVGLALVAPAATILYWLIRGLETDQTLGSILAALGPATFNSVKAALLAALTAVTLALPVAYLSVRSPSRSAFWMNRLVYLGYGLPGIVIALSLVFFGANYAQPIYQTLVMLVAGYTVRFLPQALGTLRANLMQISPRLEDAARSLGLNQRQALLRVTLPLMRPGLWAGVALVFLNTIKELPVTLLLGPTNFATLATQIWSATAEAFYARAAAPALLLLVVSACSIVIILRQEERGIS